MDGERQPPEDLRIDLDWPGDPVPAHRRRNVGSGEAGPSAERLGTGADPEPNWPDDEDVAPNRPSAPGRLPTRQEGGRSEAELRTSPLEHQQAARLSRLAEETSATRARLDTLTDAVITMRSYLNDRMGDVNQAVSRSEAQLSREISQAVERIPSPADLDLEAILERSRQGLAGQLRDAVAATRADLTTELEQAMQRFAGPEEVEEQVGRIHDTVAASLERAFGSLNVQVGRHVDEVVGEARTQTVNDVQRMVSDAHDLIAERIEEASNSAQRQMAQQSRELQRELERSSATLGRLMDQARTTGVGIEELGASLAAELADAANSLAQGMDESTLRLAQESRASSERAFAEVGELGDTVAGALNRVADRLERLATRNGEQEDVVEAVADALDDVAERVNELDRSRRAHHAELLALLAEQREEAAISPPELGTITVAVGDLAEGVDAILSHQAEVRRHLDGRPATDPQLRQLADQILATTKRQERALEDRPLGDPAVAESIAGVQAGIDRLGAQVERIAARPASDPALVRALGELEASVDGLSELAESFGEQLASQASTDPAVTSGLGDLRRTVHSLKLSVDRQASSLQERSSAVVIDTVERRFDEVMAHLPQAEDGQVDAVERRVADLDRHHRTEAAATREVLESVADTVERMASAQAEDLERILDAVEARASAAGQEESSVIADQLSALGQQVDALRRRLSVRARAPELSDSAIEAIADRIAARLTPPQPTSPAPLNRRRKSPS